MGFEDLRGSFDAVSYSVFCIQDIISPSSCAETIGCCDLDAKPLFVAVLCFLLHNRQNLREARVCRDRSLDRDALELAALGNLTVHRLY